MELLERGKVGFRIEANSKPSDLYVARADHDKYGLALSVDHGALYGKVYYLLTEGMFTKDYDTLDEAKSALMSLINVRGKAFNSQMSEELKNKKVNLTISEDWRITQARPIPVLCFSDEDEYEFVEWRERESRTLLKRISSITD
jgi:hypothetical protein